MNLTIPSFLLCHSNKSIAITKVSTLDLEEPIQCFGENVSRCESEHCPQKLTGCSQYINVISSNVMNVGLWVVKWEWPQQRRRLWGKICENSIVSPNWLYTVYGAKVVKWALSLHTDYIHSVLGKSCEMSVVSPNWLYTVYGAKVVKWAWSLHTDYIQSVWGKTCEMNFVSTNWLRSVWGKGCEMSLVSPNWIRSAWGKSCEMSVVSPSSLAVFGAKAVKWTLSLQTD